jgi:hypothetical protein
VEASTLPFLRKKRGPIGMLGRVRSGPGESLTMKEHVGYIVSVYPDPDQEKVEH